MNTPRSRLTFLLVPLLIFIFAAASQAYNRTLDGFVQKVSDGDTVTLVTHNGTRLRVRLYGIDAPEVRHEKKPGQPFGEDAKKALTGKVLRKGVAITIQDRDQYKRVVGIIRIGNRNINEEMVREGWAWAYREYLRGPYVSEFINGQVDDELLLSVEVQKGIEGLLIVRRNRAHPQPDRLGGKVQVLADVTDIHREDAVCGRSVPPLHPVRDDAPEERDGPLPDEPRPKQAPEMRAARPGSVNSNRRRCSSGR